MVFRGHAFFQIVCHDRVGVDQRGVVAGSLLHDSHTPVEVGGVAIAQVVVEAACEVGSCEECLVADQHAVAEGAPGEVLGRREMTGMQEVAFSIHDVGVTIDHGGHLLGFCGCLSHAGQHHVIVEAVAGVEEDDEVAGCHVNGFVHGVVESIVGFTEALDFVGNRSHAVSFLIVVDVFQRFVARVSIDNQVFHVLPLLFLDASDGAFDERGGVEGDCCHRDFGFPGRHRRCAVVTTSGRDVRRGSFVLCIFHCILYIMCIFSQRLYYQPRSKVRSTKRV